MIINLLTFLLKASYNYDNIFNSQEGDFMNSTYVSIEISNRINSMPENKRYYAEKLLDVYYKFKNNESIMKAIEILETTPKKNIEDVLNVLIRTSLIEYGWNIAIAENIKDSSRNSVSYKMELINEYIIENRIINLTINLEEMLKILNFIDESSNLKNISSCLNYLFKLNLNTSQNESLPLLNTINIDDIISLIKNIDDINYNFIMSMIFKLLKVIKTKEDFYYVANLVELIKSIGNKIAYRNHVYIFCEIIDNLFILNDELIKENFEGRKLTIELIADSYFSDMNLKFDLASKFNYDRNIITILKLIYHFKVDEEDYKFFEYLKNDMVFLKRLYKILYSYDFFDDEKNNLINTINFDYDFYEKQRNERINTLVKKYEGTSYAGYIRLFGKIKDTKNWKK